MSKHAVLSPSGAHRWLNCTPSARLELTFPDAAGAAAEEGTLAHKLGELLIEYKLKRVSKTVFNRRLSEIQQDKLYEDAMLEHCDGYAVFVLEKFSDAQIHTTDALLFLEQKLDLTDYVPGGFGTGDTVIIADNTLTLIDLKYGKGVPVSADNNRQLMLYGLGALREFDFSYDIHEVEMIIYQPRLDSFSSFTMKVEDLKEWAETELRPRAELAFKGEGDYKPGIHCRFCRAKAVCKANADYNLELAKHDFKNPDLLQDEDISEILDRADQFKKWLSAVETYALTEAVNNGKKWPGYKIVEGRSNRMYSDAEAVAKKLLDSGYDESVIYNKKLVGITDMEKALTKPVFNSTLGDLVVKPAGKPTLVPESDKRPEYNTVEAAQIDFADVEIDN